MDELFARIAADVKQSLLELGDKLICFTIGKTDNPKDREYDYLNQDYTHFCVICKGSSDTINEGEKYLISYFMKHCTLKDKLTNERNGGGGNTLSDTLYIATKNTEETIDDLYGNILPTCYPINIETKEANQYENNNQQTK